MLWSPQPKQLMALKCPADELFYGGAAGGGKTDFLIVDAVSGAARWGKDFRAIIFRQSREQLGQLLRRANELYVPIGAKFRQQSQYGHNIYFFPNGASIQFTYLDCDRDVENYQGNEFAYVGFDELGNYPSDYAWNYMQSRLRSVKGIKSYIRGTGNPGGRGQGWIKQRFMEGRLPNRIYRKTVLLPSGREAVTTQCYIPSTLYDNKKLVTQDPDYEARLFNMPKHLRDALLRGNWDVFAGQIFSAFKAETHVRPHFVLDARYWYKFCSLDWGYAKPYDLQYWAVNAEGKMYMYRELYGCAKDEYNKGLREGSDSVARRGMAIAGNEGVTMCVADPAIWNKIDKAPSVAETFEAAGWHMIKANNDRINGLLIFNQMLENTDAAGIPMLTVAPECTGFIRTVPSLTPDPNREEDVDTRLEDHPYDAARYAVMSDFAQHPTRYIIDRERIARPTRETWDPFAR